MTSLPTFTPQGRDYRVGHSDDCALWLDNVNYDCSCGETQRRGAIVRAMMTLSASHTSATEEA